MYPTPIAYGGLGLSSFAVGVIMSITGVLIGLSSLVVLPRVVERYGARRAYQTSFAVYLLNPILFTLMSIVARMRGGVDGLVWVLIGMQLLVGSVSCQCFGEYFICHCMLKNIDKWCLRFVLYLAKRVNACPINRFYKRSCADCGMLNEDICAIRCLFFILAVSRKEPNGGDDGILVPRTNCHRGSRGCF